MTNGGIVLKTLRTGLSPYRKPVVYVEYRLISYYDGQ